MLQSLRVSHDRTGIYNIRCKIHDKRYVGSAEESMQKRGYKHRGELNRGVHINPHLQHAWNLYGEDAFEFECIEFCEVADIEEREQHWIDHLDTLNPEKGYNIALKAKRSPMSGRKHTVASRQKMAAANTGRIQSQEEIDKRRQANTGKKRTKEQKDAASASHYSRGPQGEEVYQKISKALRGRSHTDEQNAVTSATTKAAMARPEVRAKLQGVNKGRKLSKETKEKIADGMRKVMTPEARQNLSDHFRGKPLSPEHRQKIRAAKLTYEARKRAEKAAARKKNPPSERILFED